MTIHAIGFVTLKESSVFSLQARSHYDYDGVRMRPQNLLSIERNSIRLGGPTHGIVIKAVHKTMPGGGGGPGGGEVQGVGGVGGPLGRWVGGGGGPRVGG